MKRIYVLIFASLIFLGCKRNEVDLIFGKTPEERISEGITELKTSLVSAENGWIGLLDTEIGGGYGFYINFKDDETLEMIMDGNSSGLSDYGSSDEVVKSTYRIKHVMGISLLFDTYNYLTLLQDPVPGVGGGAAGMGLGSDVDFELVEISENKDTIHLKGKRHGKSLTLYKASSNEQRTYLNGIFSDAIEKTDDFFNPLGANFFELDGAEVQIVINNATKKSDLIMLDVSADTLIYKNAPYAYTADGFDFVTKMIFKGKEFTKIRLEGNDYYIYEVGGEKYKLNYSDEQIISLKYAIGVSINELVIPGPYSYPNNIPLQSWSSSFVNHWNSYTNLAKNGGYNLTIGNNFYVFDTVNKRINVSGTIYQGTSAFGTSYYYTYEFTSDGNIKFNAVGGANGNAGIIIPYMNTTYHTRLLNDNFTLGYDIDPVFGKLVKFTSVQNPSYYFTMVIN